MKVSPTGRLARYDRYSYMYLEKMHAAEWQNRRRDPVVVTLMCRVVVVSLFSRWRQAGEHTLNADSA